MAQNVKDESRFDYNRTESVKLRKQIDKKREELLKNGPPKIQMIPTISLSTLASGIIGILAVMFLWFGHYPEPPVSPILFQWEEMGQKFDYKGYEIFYIDQQNATITEKHETLVYLHGFPTSSFDLHLIYSNLTKIFHRIVAPDMIGFGFSAKPRSYSYSIMDQTDLIVSLLDKLALKDVHLLTHDYGDTVGQELMARSRENKLNFKLKSVCMMNGGVFPAVHTPVLSQRLFRIPILKTILAKFANFPLFSKSINGVFGEYTQATYSELQDFWKLIRINDGYRVWADLLTYIDDRREHEDRWVGALRSSASTPFHFIYGPADPVNPSAKFIPTFTGIVGKNHLTTLPDHIGHYPMIEAPHLVVRSYFDFLAKHSLFTIST